MRDPRENPQIGDVVAFGGHTPHNVRVIGVTPTGRIRIRTYYNDLDPRNSAVRLDKWRTMCRAAIGARTASPGDGSTGGRG
jgi:hypothetical protein